VAQLDCITGFDSGLQHKIKAATPITVSVNLSSMVPTNLRCPLPVRCATNLVADVEVGSRCLLIFFRRSTNHQHEKLHFNITQAIESSSRLNKML
jgi:hypothetical protein